MLENVIRVRMKTADTSRLEKLASIERTTKSQIIRNAVLDALDDRLEMCHVCNSTETEFRDVHVGASVISEARCADCGTVWEV